MVAEDLSLAYWRHQWTFIKCRKSVSPLLMTITNFQKTLLVITMWSIFSTTMMPVHKHNIYCRYTIYVNKVKYLQVVLLFSFHWYYEFETVNSIRFNFLLWCARMCHSFGVFWSLLIQVLKLVCNSN